MSQKVEFHFNLHELDSTFSVTEEFSLNEQLFYGDFEFVKTDDEDCLRLKYKFYFIEPDCGYQINIEYIDGKTKKISPESFNFLKYNVKHKIAEPGSFVVFKNWNETKNRSIFGIKIIIRYFSHKQFTDKQKTLEQQALQKKEINYESKASPAEIAAVIAEFPKEHLFKRVQEIADVYNNGI